MAYRFDLTGQRFGKLTVLEFVERRKLHSMWKCQCDCGNIRIVSANNLRKKHTQSCGCVRFKHGMWTSPEFSVWGGMKSRCYNKNDKDYRIYGALGITVCERWLESFSAFYEDMGPRPSPALTIDRIDGTKGYCKENCRWATWKQQQRNRKNNHLILFEGKQLTMAEVSERTGISPQVIRFRMKAGWPQELLFKPVRSWVKKHILSR